MIIAAANRRDYYPNPDQNQMMVFLVDIAACLYRKVTNSGSICVSKGT